MKITVGINTINSSGMSFADFDVKLELSVAERNLLDTNNVPVPGDTGSTYDLLRRCFSSHGDFYRTVQISNYRSYQPDAASFRASSSNGWQRFMNWLVADAERDILLERTAHIFINKLSILTKKIKPVVISETLTKPRPIATAVTLTDLTGKTMQLRIGNKLFGVHEVNELTSENALIQTAIGDLETRASAQVEGFASEYSGNLVLLKSQYDHEIYKLKEQMKTQLPALDIPYELLAQGVQCVPRGSQYELFIPIRLHYKYLAAPWHIWKLKKIWQHKQDAVLRVRVDKKFAVGRVYILDKKLCDNVPLWHCNTSDDFCLGTYTPTMTSIKDIVKIRNEMRHMFEKINTASMSTRNLRGQQQKLYGIVDNAPFIEFDDVPDDREAIDFNEVATLQLRKEHTDGTWST